MNRQISKIEPADRQKLSVFLNDEWYASFYKGEVRRLKLEPGMEWTDSLEAEAEAVLYRRGKDRALYLLQQKAYTTAELQRKLRQNGYSVSAVARILEFLETYGFTDDRQYAEQYIRSHSRKESRKQMKQKLLLKGLPRSLIEALLEESEDSEETAILSLLEKRLRHREPAELSRDEIRKELAYLGSRGFSYETAKTCMQRYLGWRIE